MDCLRGFTVAAILAGLFCGGCGGGGILAPDSGEEEEKDRLGVKVFPGSATRVFISAKRAFEEMEIQQTSLIQDEKLSGVIHSDKPGDPSILVSLTFTHRGKGTLVESVIYNVRAGPMAKQRLQEKLFNTMEKRIRRIATLE